MRGEFDEISGQHTTGHEWNGIKELNTPMPRAFHIWLWLSIAVCVLLWILYPSFPGIRDYARGLLGYSSRVTVNAVMAETGAERDAQIAVFQSADWDALLADATLRERFEPEIAVLFRDNCSACHGRDARGQTGFPNLTDDHWLWSGLPEEVEYTLQVGINAPNDDTRWAEMPAFGRDRLLEKEQINDVVEYVLQISGQDHNTEAAIRGDEIFAENCSSCHNDGGIGGLETGAPSLADAAWIYGGDRYALHETLKNGRAGVMPAWSERLSPAEIRQLTMYLLWLGQDEVDG